MGARGLAIRDDMGAVELRRFAQGEADRRAALRALAIAQALEGASRADAARVVGRERQSLRDAVLRYNAEGLAGLHDRPRSGRPEKLTAAQREELRAWVLAGPDPNFAAVRPGHDDGFALVLPEATAVTMDLFLARFAETLPAGVHAVLMLDQAGWHGQAALQVPGSITLPPYSPELNPVERVWLYLRERFLSFRLYQSEGAIVDALCAAWNALRVRQAKLARSSRWKTGPGKG